MKIDNSFKTQTTTAVSDDAERPARKAGADAESSPADTNVKISSVSSHLQAIEQGFAGTPVVDSARVAELKQAISNGHFKVDAGKVADRLLASVRDLILAQGLNTMQLDDAALCRTLHTESEALNAFIAVLREEQQALVRGDLERLSSLAESKSICLFELSRLGEQRMQWLRERGLPADRSGMERFLRQHAGGSPQARMAWQQLLDLTKTAQQLNDVNGTLIGTRLNGTKRALSVLFSAANVAGAYAPDGSTVCLRTTHELAVA